MQKVLNQEEIDAMFRAARDRQSVTSEAPKVVSCNFRQAGQIGSDQVRAISALHEGFARNLTHWLAAYLRTTFECDLVSVEQIPYREVLARIPEVAYLASLHLSPVEAAGVLQLDLALAFPIIDVLLGGLGRAEKQVRDVTEIEEEVLEGVVRIICRELQSAWDPIGIKFAFDQRQQPSQMQRIMPPTELTLSLSFEIRMPEVRGTLNLTFPSAVSTVLLRKLSRDWSYRKPHCTGESSERVRARLLQCPFVAELALTKLALESKQLLRLHPGMILPLGRSAEFPATLSVGHRQLFSATAACRGTRRAAEIVAPIGSEQREADSAAIGD